MNETVVDIQSHPEWVLTSVWGFLILLVVALSAYVVWVLAKSRRIVKALQVANGRESDAIRFRDVLNLALGRVFLTIIYIIVAGVAGYRIWSSALFSELSLNDNEMVIRGHYGYEARIPKDDFRSTRIEESKGGKKAVLVVTNFVGHEYESFSAENAEEVQMLRRAVERISDWANR